MRLMPLAVSDTYSNALMNVVGYPSDKLPYTQWRTDCTLSDNDPSDGITVLTGDGGGSGQSRRN
jgi:V8-like Glu-specific endopeptidase